MTGAARVRVLVVDDSVLVRAVLTRGLGADPGLEVVGAARDPYEARDLLVKLRPDVMTLDVEMPRMDGVTFLRRVMAVLPTPTIILSSLTTSGSTLAVQALAAGAIDVVAKPAADVASALDAMMARLIDVVKAAARARVAPVGPPPAVLDAHPPAALDQTTDQVIGLGASTGGVAALGRILPMFPAWTPGVVIVQHMPPGFTADFAKRLDGTCAMRVAEASDGERVLPGHVLVAPGGDRHLEVRRVGGQYRIKLVARRGSEPGHCPSVDVFFHSLAHHVGKNATACLLTGMGADGADGLAAMRAAGAHTFAQDRASCAVWGMPAAAAERGAAERLVPLTDVPTTLLRALAG